jgi:hypothetical protein
MQRCRLGEEMEFGKTDGKVFESARKDVESDPSVTSDRAVEEAGPKRNDPVL